MGMAASQARLLSLTARIHDVEYEAQMIQSAKLQLATQEDAAYKRYTDALDAQSLTFKTDTGNTIAASFNNICGLASISNGMSRNYVFRTNSGKLSDDLIIVPDDVFDAYSAMGESDPYAFAMSMIGADIDEIVPSGKFDSEGNEILYSYSEYLLDMIKNSPDDQVISLREQAETIFNEKIKNNLADGKDLDDYDVSQMLYEYQFAEQPHAYFKNIDDYKENREDIDKFIEIQQKLLHRIYNLAQADIFEMFGGKKDDFAKHEDEFNYYLHWAQLISYAGGIGSCTKMSTEYGAEDLGDDAKFLTDMVQCGKITIDQVSFKNGVITDKVTSASSDSNLAMINTSEIDATELKKAEAEYEHTMKQIDRKDKNYDMDLNKLETERTALTTEYDSVKKVIQENIERTFKIFS